MSAKPPTIRVEILVGDRTGRTAVVVDNKPQGNTAGYWVTLEHADGISGAAYFYLPEELRLA